MRGSRSNRRPEVDAERLAVNSFSWGGHIVFKAGRYDRRIQALIANPAMPNVFRAVLAQQGELSFPYEAADAGNMVLLAGSTIDVVWMDAPAGAERYELQATWWWLPGGPPSLSRK